ncbi:MAG: undecaprenyl-diphosphate phosphatase [Woeseiaceae bacterium]|nr:undecaprenyl-diphosphate phosphatase [Woeseiaceae bacterium]
MTWLQVVVLAIVQGLTEFLPISSSGHLVLVPYLAGWADQGLVFDVAVHFGSLAAVVIYFRRDLAGLLRGGLALVGGSSRGPESTIALGVALGTVPAAAAGLLFAGWIEENLRSALVVVVTLSFWGVVMAAADTFCRHTRSIADFSVRDAFLVGCAQALALIPGTSRSGITITAGRMLGYARQDAARFSFLLSAPVILLATAYETLGMLLSDEAIAWSRLGIAAAVSAVVAYVCIDLMMRFVGRIGLVPFAVYRLVLAGIIVWVAF